MRIGVLGGTGVAGGAAVQELRSRGHEVRVLSRAAGFDVTAPGDGAALAGLDALVDCLNPSRTSAKATRAVLVDGLRATLAAAATHGVGHVVSLSIVGIEHLPIGYYRVKLEQESVVRDQQGLAGTVLRATQFPDLFDLAWGATRRLGVILAPRGTVAPILPADVAVALADLVEAGPGAAPEHQAVRGAEIVGLRQVAADWKRVRGSRRPVVGVPAIGGALRAVAAGELVDAALPAAPRGWSDWIAAAGSPDPAPPGPHANAAPPVPR